MKRVNEETLKIAEPTKTPGLVTSTPSTSTEATRKRQLDDSSASLEISAVKKRIMDNRDLKQLDTRLNQMVEQFKSTCNAMVEEVIKKKEEWQEHNDVVAKFNQQNNGILKSQFDIREKLKNIVTENKSYKLEVEELKKKNAGLKLQIQTNNDTIKRMEKEIEEMRKFIPVPCSIRVAEPSREEVNLEVELMANEIYEQNGLPPYHAEVSDISDAEVDNGPN